MKKILMSQSSFSQRLVKIDTKGLDHVKGWVSQSSFSQRLVKIIGSKDRKEFNGVAILLFAETG